MTITQYEQSGVLITSASEQTLAIDIGALTPLEALADITVDAMLVSHIHADHCSAAHIATLQPSVVYTGAECQTELSDSDVPIKTIEAGDSITIGEYTVQVFEVDHGPNTPRVPSQNFGFLIEVDGKTLYYAGDMYHPSGIDVTELAVDAALLPVGGHYTFDAEAAFQFAQTFASIGTIYPMHHEAVGPIDTNGRNTFASLAVGTFSIAD